MTRNDLLKANADLIPAAAATLQGGPARRPEEKLVGSGKPVPLKVETRN